MRKPQNISFGRDTEVHLGKPVFLDIEMTLEEKNLAANARDARDTGSIPESGRSPGVANGNPLQYSCLENSTGQGAWRATVHGVARSWTRLSN